MPLLLPPCNRAASRSSLMLAFVAVVLTGCGNSGNPSTETGIGSAPSGSTTGSMSGGTSSGTSGGSSTTGGGSSGGTSSGGSSGGTTVGGGSSGSTGGGSTGGGSGGSSTGGTTGTGTSTRALSSYLHDVSTKIDGVTYDNATLEHYRIPVSDGTVLDGWVRRPPGMAGQPLVLVFSPYYGGGDPSLSALGDPSTSFGGYLIPYGYAVGFVSVGGTGNSGGCFRDGGPIERQQLYDAAEYMAHQTWSNGNVAAIGVSYDGTTAHELFVQPPPSIKTVVPMEGITDYYRYTFNIGGIPRADNTFFTTYYYPIVGLSPAGLEGGEGPTDPTGYETELSGEPCPEQLSIQQESVTTEASADKTPYWHDRDALELIRNTPDLKRPPMFFIEGFEDANVDPQMADGYLELVKQTGVPLHVWFGQWVHAYPQDGSCAKGDPCRGDFWDSFLVAWFDQFLKERDTGVLDAPAVQLEADDGVWRHEDLWPPATNTLTLYPHADGTLGTAPGTATSSYVDSGSNHTNDSNTGERVALPEVPGTFVEFVSAPLSAPLRLTGLPKLAIGATSSGSRANVVVTFMARKADGTQRYVNFGALNLNHAASLDSGDMDITGKALAATFNFFPQDNVIEAGDTLVLHIGGDVENTRTASGNLNNFLNYGMNVLPIAVGATVTLDLTQFRLDLPSNPGNRVEDIPWAQ